MDAGACFAGAFDPGVDEAEDAIGAEQILYETEARGVVGDFFEDGVVPEDEAEVIVDVFPAVDVGVEGVVAVGDHAFDGFFDLDVVVFWADFFGGHDGKSEGLEFGDVCL